jgi:XTP/dITP diphosphohydrolase
VIVVLATANPDKAGEIGELWRALLPNVELRPRPPEVADVEETGATLEDNARLKARALAAATGLPAVADDTGLEVVALSGAPGVLTARFAGDNATYGENVAKLLGALAGVTERRARFRTVAVLAWPDGREIVADGAVDGTIAASSRGVGGFGYDPVFEPEGGGGATFAELTSAAKHDLSHRGRAFRALAAELARITIDAGERDANRQG